MGLSRLNTPVLHFDDLNGRPLVGGRLYTFAAGTTTPATTYRDKDGREANENPVPLNERGECVVWIDDTKRYKLTLLDPSGNVVWSQDDVTSSGGGSPIYPGDVSDATVTFTAASTRTNVSTGEKLAVLFGKIAKWFGDLKALAFKDKVNTNDLENGAVTADKVKDGEVLPVNVSGYASHLRQAKCRFEMNDIGYRLMAHLPPKSGYYDTLYVFNIYQSRDNSELYAGILKGTLSISIRNNDGAYNYSSAYIGSLLNDISFDLRVDPNTHGVNLYASKSTYFYSFAIFELLNAYDQYGEEMNATLYANSELLQSVVGEPISTTFTLLKIAGGTIPLANDNGVGSATQPVYVGSDGEVRPCTRKVWRLAIFSNDNHVRDLDNPDINDSTGYSKLKWSDLSSSENRNNDVILLNKSTNKYSSPKVALFRSVTTYDTLIGYANAPTIVGSAYRGVCVCCAVLMQDGQNVELYGDAIDYIGPLYKSYGGSTTSSMNAYNHAVYNLTNNLSDFTINIVTINSEDSADFLAEITNNIQCTVTVTINGTAAKYSSALGNTMSANKFYRLRCEGSCWTLEEFV